ncbi:hypothetical protein ATCC90586_004725 [Pythium insidiosum]|nr:hypothetical protein ATCC90586_004725 [Pythium insidiosum]
MFCQPALAHSAFRGLHDELLAYWTLFCDVDDLLTLARVNSVFYVFAREEPLWMLHCLRLHGGAFSFHQSWRLTTFFPRPERRPAGLPASLPPPLQVRGFGSDFLYRRWCRCHMPLAAFVPPTPTPALPAVQRMRRLDVRALSYRQFYEQYARVPFILEHAISSWPATARWTLEQLAERFSDAALRHRITHNLDTDTAASSAMAMPDYAAYLRHQADETPLYIFDPRFGEKMPELLRDYDVSSLRVFREDLLGLLQNASACSAAAEKDTNANANANGSLSPDFRWLVIGPQRSGAPWHTDPARTSAWNALLQGRKRWALYPPGHPPPGVGATTRDRRSGRESVLDMTSLAWYLHVYPTLAPHERPLEVLQEPGDVIYVPSGWWHLVLNLETTVAVTHNFVDSHNLVAFASDLLEDGQDDALQRLQQGLKAAGRRDTYDVFRMLTVPRQHGFLSHEAYTATFRVVEQWKPRLATVLRRHRLPRPAAKAQRSLKSVTARVNPAFAVDGAWLVKFYSEFNQDWGEFSIAAYLAPRFDDDDEDDNENDSPKRRRQTTGEAMEPHQLKTAMSLRYAMEECFRIERSVYELLGAAAERPDLRELAAMVPTMAHASHLLDVSDVDDADGDGSFWRWPYVVMTYRRDLVGIRSLLRKGGATPESWQRLARWLSAEFVPRLHRVPLPQDGHWRGLYGHDKASWRWYSHYLLLRRKNALAFHLGENAVPPQLLNALEAFLPPATREGIERLVLPAWHSDAAPVLLHGDLTDENVLGSAARQPASADADADADAAGRERERLVAWLRAIGCDKFVALLTEQHELTAATMALVSESQLEAIGVPLGPRLAMLNALDRLATEPCDEHSDSDSEDSESDDSDDDDEDTGVLTDPAAVAAIKSQRQKRFYGAHDWTPSFVIDFADAKTGDPLYDLVAILFAALH